MGAIRVLVAEDSITLRELLVSILDGDPEVSVVGQARNGVEAIEMTGRLRPDLVTMDVHMPLMDGFEATKEIMARFPTPILIVSSSASEREVEMSLNAMRAGALMLIPKPDRPGAPEFDGLQDQFLSMVKALSQVKVVRRKASPPQRTDALMPLPPEQRIRMVAIACSTGGPAALHRILGSLPADFPAPITVVQHISPGFVNGLATWLGRNCDLRVKVAEGGELIRKRTVYIAPDNHHLGVASDHTIQLSSMPAVAGFRPSATWLFESVAKVYGSGVAAVILTGMGNDGVEGLRVVRKAGGRILAQDRESSIVFGMPRDAVAAGVVDTVAALDHIAPWLTSLTSGSTR